MSDKFKEGDKVRVINDEKYNIVFSHRISPLHYIFTLNKVHAKMLNTYSYSPLGDNKFNYNFLSNELEIIGHDFLSEVLTDINNEIK